MFLWDYSDLSTVRMTFGIDRLSLIGTVIVNSKRTKRRKCKVNVPMALPLSTKVSHRMAAPSWRFLKAAAREAAPL